MQIHKWYLREGVYIIIGNIVHIIKMSLPILKIMDNMLSPHMEYGPLSGHNQLLLRFTKV